MVRQLLLETNAHDRGGVDCKTRCAGHRSRVMSTDYRIEKKIKIVDFFNGLASANH